MADTQQKSDPILSVESVSSVFAHDISTPLTTARLNAELLQENIKIITEGLKSSDGQQIPAHIRQALEKAPELIQTNLKEVQHTLSQYKQYLNSLHEKNLEKEEDTSQITPITHASGPLKILLVDDEDIHHDIGDAVLGAIHTISHEKSGEDALKRCKKEHFDVILMDMQMPRLPGPQTTEQLRGFVDGSTLIVGLTNMPIAAKKVDLMECGFSGFLDKPLKLGAFNELIESLTNN